MDSLRRDNGICVECVIPYANGRLLQNNIHKIAPSGSGLDLISHEGEEVAYVISGESELFVSDKAYQLSVGDTFNYRSEIDRGYRNRVSTEASISFVNTPPTSKALSYCSSNLTCVVWEHE